MPVKLEEVICFRVLIVIPDRRFFDRPNRFDFTKLDIIVSTNFRKLFKDIRPMFELTHKRRNRFHFFVYCHGVSPYSFSSA